MVRKPRAVWPGLVRNNMYQKQIAGDGNCLFASLSDQLYGDPTKHTEIRSKIIDHMRTFRPLFEGHVHKDDVQQRRTTRAAANSASQDSTDAFEEYLTLMSKPGTYGGEPELVAFTQAYDQDVSVHLPKDTGLATDSLFYTNEHRRKLPEGEEGPVALHICYGGDEVTRAHYDSARNKDGSCPRDTQSPKPSPRLEAQDSRRNSALPTTLSPALPSASSSTPSVTPFGAPPLAPSSESTSTNSPSARALRNSEMSGDFLHEVIQKSKKDLDASLDALNNRPRSTSLSSSHRSSSSKRSLEDDGEHPRRKRADRRKSTRKRTDMSTVSYEDDDGQIRVHSPSHNILASTQGTEVASDVAERESSDSEDGEYRPGDDVSDIETTRTKRKIIQPSSRLTANNKSATRNSLPIQIAERPRHTLRT